MLTNRYISVDIVNQTWHSHLLLMIQVYYTELLLLLLQLRLLQNHHIPKVYEAITSHENSVSCADDKLSTFAKKPVLVSRRAEKGLT